MNKSILTFIALMSSACATFSMNLSLDTIWFTGASVLPVTYFYRPQEGKYIKYVLLSREAFGPDQGTWDAFGGSRDPGENHPEITAAREFSEEAITEKTLGLSNNDARTHIRDNSEAIIAKQVNNARTGHSQYFVTYMPKFSCKDINSFRRNFNQARSQAQHWTNREKDGLAVVRWDELVEAVQASQSNDGVQVSAREFDFQTGKDKTHRSTITIRPLLVKVLRPYVNDQLRTPGTTHFYQ